MARAADAAAVVGFGALFAACGLEWAAAAGAHGETFVLMMALPFGIAAADLVTGVIHWAGDTFFEEDTPVLGPRWIHPFREHHRDPRAITRHGFFEVSGNNCLLLFALLACARLLGPGLENAVGRSLWATLLAFSGAVAVSNQLHRWAHTDSPPAVVRWLQRHWMALPPSAHEQHHDGPHDRAFCVTTGWCNPVLDQIELFRWLERHVAGRRGSSQGPHTTGS